MKVLFTFSDLSAARKKIQGKLGFVPTMGALHDGHISLIHEIRKHVDTVLVSIFVNPTQFGPSEDFAKYPRIVEKDMKKLEEVADYLYLPQVNDIYPQGEKVTVHASPAAKGLCGDFRPGHFDGVATVVSILFNQVKPDYAAFGEKDFQQLQVIRDLNSPVKIIGVPTMRETDGLAMSSRNAYLSDEERKLAPKLYQTMKKYIEPETVKTELENFGFKVQYVEKRWDRMLAAAYLGKTRLIDNIPLE